MNDLEKIVCVPINKLRKELQNNGIEEIDKQLIDHHFHELLFIYNNHGKTIPKIEISGIINENNRLFHCECHWSTLKIFENK